MRTGAPSVLPFFRSELQLRALAFIYTAAHPVTPRELVDALTAPEASVHRELHRALDAGLLEREAVGRTFRYVPATTSPLYEPLRQLLDRTVGVEAELATVLGSLPGVDAAVLHGSYARGTRVRPTSDVDVLIVGEVDYRKLRDRVRRIERRTGRRIDTVAYSREEFRELLRQRNSFVRGILRGPSVKLVGDLAEVLANDSS